MLLELTAKIRLHSLPIHLKLTSRKVHQLNTTVWENLGDHNSPDHLDLSFPRNNFNLELKSNTCYPG